MAGSKARKITFFFIILVVIIAIIAVLKIFQFKSEMAAFAKMAPPPPTISTAKVTNMSYQKTDTAVGTFAAINGVEVTPQVSGKIVKIYIHSGEAVQQGQPLIKLDDRAALAAFDTSKADFQNAKVTMMRDQRLIKVHAIGQSTYDNDLTAYRKAKATMLGNQVTLSQHVVRAPFAGKLGISQVNLGQFLNPGEDIITLQTQTPIHLNFVLPESDLAQLTVGGQVDALVGRYPNKTFHGSINAINSTIDPTTHTISVQATFQNNNNELFPGGFATAKVHLGQPVDELAIPNTAVTYRLYGDSVYLVTQSKQDGKTVNTSDLHYITVGDPINADYVAVTKGLKVGDEIVSSGQNKLQIKNTVLINNKVPTNVTNPMNQLS